MEVSNEALKELEAALKKYSEELDASELSLASKAIYLDHATNFVRWIKGEFRAGSVKSPWPTKKPKPVPSQLRADG